MKKLVIALASFLFIGGLFSQEEQKQDPNLMRLYEAYTYIKRMYVDSVDTKKISEAAIRGMIKQLDPHTSFIPAEHVERAERSINGSFVGVGIRFNILRDTLLVVNTIPGGPSEKVGVRAGDKIIEVDGESIAGVGLKNSGVRKRLLGEKGTKVKIVILRGTGQPIKYTITRDKIPLNSVVSFYMVDDNIGYIKLTSFSRTTRSEVISAIKALKKEGMKDLILDLEGNGGGLLSAAKSVADEFLADDKLIVFSKGRTQPRMDLRADKKGNFEKGKLVVLIDENSASASEIVSGAVQDWDRGLIIGRRSFGKGLVERPIMLSDGSELRLTIARYYTPSGRWIQKPYDDREAYQNDYLHRFEHGELMHRDSINLNDSLEYKTLLKKRIVYGGGGIMPDIFVPLDTMEYSQYYKKLSRSGSINSFSLDYVNENREQLNAAYKDVDDFKSNFAMDKKVMDEFFAYATDLDSNLTFNAADYKISEDLLKKRIKAMIAENLWGFGAFYEIFNSKNEIFMKAIEALKDGTYKKMDLRSK